MTHSGERFSRCAHCGHKIRQRQTMGVWKHFATNLRECLATTRAEPGIQISPIPPEERQGGIHR